MECFNNLSWLPAKKYILIYFEYNKLLPPLHDYFTCLPQFTLLWHYWFFSLTPTKSRIIIITNLILCHTEIKWLASEKRENLVRHLVFWCEIQCQHTERASLIMSWFSFPTLSAVVLTDCATGSQVPSSKVFFLAANCLAPSHFTASSCCNTNPARHI